MALISKTTVYKPEGGTVREIRFMGILVYREEVLTPPATEVLTPPATTAPSAMEKVTRKRGPRKVKAEPQAVGSPEAQVPAPVTVTAAPKVRVHLKSAANVPTDYDGEV
jgi:hypothetical protein